MGSVERVLGMSGYYDAGDLDDRLFNEAYTCLDCEVSSDDSPWMICDAHETASVLSQPRPTLADVSQALDDVAAMLKAIVGES